VKNQKKEPKKASPVPLLSELEAEVIALFVQISRALGQPRSLAEIYGLLFISPQPLALDDLIDRLGLSRGSASQGLRFLRNNGAIKIVYVAGSRRMHYEAVAELRNLSSRFLRYQIVPQLDGGLSRIDTIAEKLKELPAAECARLGNRISVLQSWGKKGREFLPLIATLLEN